MLVPSKSSISIKEPCDHKALFIVDGTVVETWSLWHEYD